MHYTYCSYYTPYMNYDNYFVLYLFIFAVVPDDDQLSQHGQDNIPPRSCFDVHGALEDDKVQRLS